MNCFLGTTIAIIYRPPNSTSKPCEFTTELSDLIDGGSLGERFIICGDLNCLGPVGTKGLVGKELSDLIDGYSLTQHVKDPTHRSGNILDHILSPHGVVSVSGVAIVDASFSDHSLVNCKVTMDIKQQPVIRASFKTVKN